MLRSILLRPAPVLAVLLLGLALGAPAVAGEWTGWRGPYQNGVSDATDLPSSWSKDGENLIWRVDFEGRSGVVVVDGRNDAFAQLWNGYRDDYTHYRDPGHELRTANAEWKPRFRASHLFMLLVHRGQLFGFSRMTEHPIYGAIDRAAMPTPDQAREASLDPARGAGLERHLLTLAESVERAYAGLEYRPDVLVTSYHGLPKRYLTEGDPYHCHCQKTSRLLREALGMGPEELVVTFQSRFGPEEWLQPYTVEEVARLAQAGKRRLAIIAPAFSSDCVETLEEINEEIRESFEHAGGESFTYIPCLNDDDAHIAALCETIDDNLKGWIG